MLMSKAQKSVQRQLLLREERVLADHLSFEQTIYSYS